MCPDAAFIGIEVREEGDQVDGKPFPDRDDPPPYRRNQIFRGPRRLLVDIDGVRD